MKDLTLSIGFSPCPNDTFIFDALVNKKIDLEGINFEPVLEDVETLNQWAFDGRLDITKLSFPAFFQVSERYILLHSGGALGKGVGPLLVSKYEEDDQTSVDDSTTVALPGVHTTANLLFDFACPGFVNKKFMIFSQIEDAVLNGRADIGVIIHENRFTYEQKGLYKVIDLGEYWEKKMQVPIPLGCIAVKRTVDRSVALKIDGLIRESLKYAFKNYPRITDYVRKHSQAMSEDVMRQHIDLYVNNYSLDYGDEGKNAIAVLHKTFVAGNKTTPMTGNLFL